VVGVNSPLRAFHVSYSTRERSRGSQLRNRSKAGAASLILVSAKTGQPPEAKFEEFL
jgi:hypothetical protein